MTGRRVVIAGLGDVGVLTAIKLSKHADVVGISAKPGLVSGQELGWRLARPDDWARHNWIPFRRFRGLDRVRTVHGTITGLDTESRTVKVTLPDGSTTDVFYDVLVIATGVTNGFWRQPTLRTAAEVGDDLRGPHEKLSAARSVIVVGGGAAAVSSAAQIAAGMAGQKDRAVLPRRPGADRPSPADLGEGPQEACRRRGDPAAEPPGRTGAGIHRRRTDRRAGAVEYRTGTGICRCRAVGHRPGPAQHRVATAGHARRERIRAGDPRTEGARPSGDLRRR